MTDNHHELGNSHAARPARRERIAGFIATCKALIAGPHSHAHGHDHAAHASELAAEAPAGLNPCCGATPGLDAAARAHAELVVVWESEARDRTPVNTWQ